MKKPRMYLKKNWLWFVLFLWTATASAQTIQGTIVDEVNEPLIGASVVLAGTTKGAITDDKGNYKLELSDGDKSGNLIFSFVGYESQTVPLDGRTTINITLQEGKSLSEVVVVGYGIQKKKDLTGPIGLANRQTG